MRTGTLRQRDGSDVAGGRALVARRSDLRPQRDRAGVAGLAHLRPAVDRKHDAHADEHEEPGGGQRGARADSSPQPLLRLHNGYIGRTAAFA